MRSIIYSIKNEAVRIQYVQRVIRIYCEASLRIGFKVEMRNEFLNWKLAPWNLAVQIEWNSIARALAFRVPACSVIREFASCQQPHECWFPSKSCQVHSEKCSFVSNFFYVGAKEI